MGSPFSIWLLTGNYPDVYFLTHNLDYHLNASVDMFQSRNQTTRDLVGRIQRDGRIFVNGAESGNNYYIRFNPNGSTTERDSEFAWKVILDCIEEK